MTTKLSVIKYCDHGTKRKISQTCHICLGNIWYKVIEFIDELVVQCDVPAIKINSLYDKDNSDRK